MTQRERQALREENRAGLVLVVLALITGVYMLGCLTPINLQGPMTGNATATVPARPTDDLVR